MGRNASEKLNSFFRGMIDGETDLFSDDYLSLRIFPKYIEYDSTFSVIFSLEISNLNDHDLFLLLPKISHHNDITVKDKSLFNGVSKIAPNSTEEFELEAEVEQKDLIKFGPIVLSFFACFEEELGTVFSGKHIEVSTWKKQIVLPVNILRFMENTINPQFEKVKTMKLGEEVVVNNPGLLLTDISTMFPNLRKCPSNFRCHWLRESGRAAFERVFGVASVGRGDFKRVGGNQ